MRAFLLTIAVTASTMIFANNVLARTAACPCSNPCPCSPCTCGGGGSSSKTPANKSGSANTEQPKTEAPKTTSKTNTPKSEPRHTDTATTDRGKTHTDMPTDHAKHHEARRERGGHGHSDGGVAVGVGVSADLSVIGRRTAEPDPFAAGPGNQPVAHTEVKLKTPKKTTGNGPADPFRDVRLTGERAKEQNNAPGPVNVSDNEQPAAPPPGKPNDDPPATDAQTRDGSNPPGPAAGFDDGIPPPALTEKDCARLRNRLLALLAAYKKALAQVDKADGNLEQLEGEAWDANNKISEGYEDQSLQLIDEGRDQWKQIDKEWGPAVRQYRTDFDAASKAHDDLVRERAAFQRMCPGVSPPEIPDLPDKRNHPEPEPYGE